MKLKTACTMIYLFVLAFMVMPVKTPSALYVEKTFFSSLDSTIPRQRGNALSEKKLIVERYIRLLARLSIFGLYCDDDNRMGYSTRVAVLQRGSIRLEKWTEEIFGSKGTYNKLEKYRTEESLRYVLGERMRTCNLGEAQFLFLTDMSPKDFRIYLSDLPFGLF